MYIPVRRTVKSGSPEAGTRRAPRARSMGWLGRARRDEDRLEEHPLFRGGSLYGSPHPNSLTPLIPGIPGGF